MKRIFLFFALCVSLTMAASSPYISKVWEYCPAPGQFINTMPLYEAGDNAESMRVKAENCLQNHNQEMISLGGYGGYIVFGFDHEVKNRKDMYDLKILGNSFYANANPCKTDRRGGSSEPGIVMVSRDVNGNGLPDDPWYELAGSEYYKPTTRHNYTLSYCRPDSAHKATPDSTYKYLNDTTYIPWFSSEGERGYMAKNSFHKQDYFPAWMPDTISFTGTIMANNGVDESHTGTYFVSYCFDWGYVDDQPNELPTEPEMHASEFDIAWAVDSAGKPVLLEGIHFVKVYTGLNQYNGWLGECSTEILDAWDMHPDGATFEYEPAGVHLQAIDSVWQGADTVKSGLNTWTSYGYQFGTYLDDSWGYEMYSAFTVSSEQDSTSTGYEQPYRSACGGAYAGQNFCVWNDDYYGNNLILHSTDFAADSLGVMVTNTAYTVTAMKDSYRMAHSFNDNDYLVLYFIAVRDGLDADTVSFYLAKDGAYVRDWTFVDLSPLGKTDSVRLAIDGSDKNAYGLNTPTYAALDNFGMPCPKGYVAPLLVRFDGRTPIENMSYRDTLAMPEKRFRNGQVVIVRNGREYTIMGTEL